MDNASKITKLVHDQLTFAKDDMKRMLAECHQRGLISCDASEFDKILNFATQSLDSSFIKTSGTLERTIRRML